MLLKAVASPGELLLLLDISLLLQLFLNEAYRGASNDILCGTSRGCPELKWLCPRHLLWAGDAETKGSTGAKGNAEMRDGAGGRGEAGGRGDAGRRGDVGGWNNY